MQEYEVAVISGHQFSVPENNVKIRMVDGPCDGRSTFMAPNVVEFLHLPTKTYYKRVGASRDFKES